MRDSCPPPEPHHVGCMSLCTECETVVEDGDDLICAGGCRRHFHPECTARADCRHLARHENAWCLPSASSASRRKGDDVVAWRCYECELSVKRCAICKQFSLGASRGRATTAICVTCPPPPPPLPRARPGAASHAWSVCSSARASCASRRCLGPSPLTTQPQPGLLDARAPRSRDGGVAYLLTTELLFIFVGGWRCAMVATVAIVGRRR